MNILLVDDDLSHAELLKMYLQAHGHRLTHCEDPRKAMEVLSNSDIHVILLDVNMPYISGVDLCVIIRTQYDLPIIMLSERAELSDRVLGLELGADDYIAKPFEPLELITRIKAVNKRYQRSNKPTKEHLNTTQFQVEQQSNNIIHGAVSIDIGRREARLGDQVLPLSTIEWNTLKILMEKPGVVFSRDDIISLLHGVEVELVTRSVDITVSRLRTHLGDNSKQSKYIKTVWGVGYTFLPQKH